MKDQILSEFFDELEVISTTKLEYFKDDDMGVSKSVRGIPGYEIFEDGSVWSNKTGKFLSPIVSGNSRYPRINLMLNQKKKTAVIHKLVAEAFIPKPKHPDITTAVWRKLPLSVRKVIQSEFQVDHINGDRTDYHVTNLRWVTAKQNRDYYYTEQKFL